MLVVRENLTINLPHASRHGEKVSVGPMCPNSNICLRYPTCSRMGGKACPYRRAPKEIRIRVVLSLPTIQDQYPRYQTFFHQLHPKYHFFDTNHLQPAALVRSALLQVLHERPVKVRCRFTPCSHITRCCRLQLLPPTRPCLNGDLLRLVSEQPLLARQTLCHLCGRLSVMA
jgi:hypothetical protein